MDKSPRILFPDAATASKLAMAASEAQRGRGDLLGFFEVVLAAESGRVLSELRVPAIFVGVTSLSTQELTEMS